MAGRRIARVRVEIVAPTKPTAESDDLQLKLKI
jgi:hypothetical protein